MIFLWKQMGTRCHFPTTLFPFMYFKCTLRQRILKQETKLYWLWYAIIYNQLKKKYKIDGEKKNSPLFHFHKTNSYFFFQINQLMGDKRFRKGNSLFGQLFWRNPKIKKKTLQPLVPYSEVNASWHLWNLNAMCS